MKKILLILFLFMQISIVNAKIYYGPYSDFTDYQLNKYETTDTMKVEKEKFYHAYKETEEIDYTEEDNGNEYIYKDIGWVSNQPKYYSEKKDICAYKNKEKRMLYFKNNTNGEAYLKDIEIIRNGFPIYKIHFLISYKDIFIEIGDYNLEELDINLTFTTSNSMNTIDMYIKVGDKEKKLKEFNQYDDIKRTIERFKNEDDLHIEYIETECDESNKQNIIVIGTLYYEQQKLFKHVNIKRKYYDIYLQNENDEYKIDKSDYIYKYRYKTREKIEINDDIKLTSYDQNLKDFIKSDNPIKIVTNTNKLINGKYDVTYITSIGNFKNDVIVDINENYHLLLKEQEKKLEQMYNNYKEYNYLVNKKNQEIKEIIENSNDKYILSEYEKCKTKLKNEEIKKQDLNITTHDNKKYIITLLVFTIIMMIAYFLKNLSNE